MQDKARSIALRLPVQHRWHPLLRLLVGASLVWGAPAPRAHAQGSATSAVAPAKTSDPVADALNAIWVLPAAEADNRASRLSVESERLSGDARWSAWLQAGVALERAGGRDRAIARYRDIAMQAGDSPFSASAAHRQRQVELKDPTPEVLDEFYESEMAEAPADGWFLVDGSWQRSDARRAAAQNLVKLRENGLSFSLFQYLRSMFAGWGELAFMGVLLSLGIGIKILELPLQIGAARSMGKVSGLKPQIETLQYVYQGEPMMLQQKTLQLYQDNGINLMGGCLLALVDLVFVIWSYISFAAFKPQMILDNAAFYWVRDITQRDLKLLGVWLLLSLLTALINPTTLNRAQAFLGVLISGALIAGVLWYFSIPAYVILFWAVLSLLGIVLSFLLWPVRHFAR